MTELLKQIKEKIRTLNHHRNAYYNLDAPKITDTEYDKLFDELKHL